jgi:hypothetical protein
MNTKQPINTNNKEVKPQIYHNKNWLLFVAIVIFLILSFFSRIWSEIHDKLAEENNNIVTAEIVDVGTEARKILGIKLKIGYVKFRYYIGKKEKYHIVESFKIRDEIEKYNIGDCIEVKINLEDSNVWEWNEERGTFQCK